MFTGQREQRHVTEGKSHTAIVRDVTVTQYVSFHNVVKFLLIKMFSCQHMALNPSIAMYICLSVRYDIVTE